MMPGKYFVSEIMLLRIEKYLSCEKTFELIQF